MAETQTWRVLTDAKGNVSEPLVAGEIASRLWSGDKTLVWAEPCQPGEPAFPQDVPEVRAVFLLEPDRLAHAWLQHPGVDAPQWIFAWVMDLCRDHPDEAWPLALALVHVARGDEDLALVAAGPLEELLSNHGLAIIERMEAEAARDPRFRRALSGVWRSSMKEAVWARLVRARGGDNGLDETGGAS